jgi:REP element-mobilizing transposase RayT
MEIGICVADSMNRGTRPASGTANQILRLAASLATRAGQRILASVILASHIIFSVYGFWLPNDPRGSWSNFVGSWDLLKFGRATKVSTHRSVANVPHDSNARRAAKLELKHPAIRFTGVQALSIARGFAGATRDAKYIIHACCVLPDHVHLVVQDHVRPIRQIVGHLKAESTRQLRADGHYTIPATSPWGKGCWVLYLHSSTDIRRAIRYVENNPLKEGKRKQNWSFVTRYVG